MGIAESFQIQQSSNQIRFPRDSEYKSFVLGLKRFMAAR